MKRAVAAILLALSLTVPVEAASNRCTPSEMRTAYNMQVSVWNGLSGLNAKTRKQACDAIKRFAEKLHRAEAWSAKHPECLRSRASFRQFQSALRRLDREIKSGCK